MSAVNHDTKTSLALIAETERSPEHRAKPEAPEQRSEGSAECDERGDRMKYGLLAQARTRRLQRALAHASLHRNAPMPTLRSSLGYMTTTARVTEDTTALGHPSGVSSDQGVEGPLPSDRSLARSLALGHRMTVLGISRFDGVAYVVEDIGADHPPIVYRLYLRGPRQGHLVPLRAWYEHSENVGELRARVAQLLPTLEPVLPAACESFMLSTRIIQRRALRIAGPGASSELPIRKFALQLVVEPVNRIGPSGQSTVTAFLSPHAQLTGVWSLASHGASGEPGDVAIARVTFTGIPSGTGLTKDTVILLTSGLYGVEESDLAV